MDVSRASDGLLKRGHEDAPSHCGSEDDAISFHLHFLQFQNFGDAHDDIGEVIVLVDTLAGVSGDEAPLRLAGRLLADDAHQVVQCTTREPGLPSAAYVRMPASAPRSLRKSRKGANFSPATLALSAPAKVLKASKVSR